MIRADEIEINNEIAAAVAVTANYGTEPIVDFARLHRIRRPPRRLDDNPETASALLNNITSYNRSEFYKFLDAVISALNGKFQSLKDMFEPLFNVVDPDKPGKLDDAKKLVATFPNVFPSDTATAIYNEFKVFFEYFLREGAEYAEKVSVQEAQNSSRNDVSITTHERSFSVLKRVENYLRSTMSADRLHYCMLLAVERDFTEKIDLKKLALKWSLLKDRRQKIAS